MSISLLSGSQTPGPPLQHYYAETSSRRQELFLTPRGSNECAGCNVWSHPGLSPWQVWDAVESGQCLGVYPCHAEAVRDACWTPCGRRFLSGSFDNKAAITDVETGECLAYPLLSLLVQQLIIRFIVAQNVNGMVNGLHIYSAFIQSALQY